MKKYPRIPRDVGRAALQFLIMSFQSGRLSQPDRDWARGLFSPVDLESERRREYWHRWGVLSSFFFWIIVVGTINHLTPSIMLERKWLELNYYRLLLMIGLIFVQLIGPIIYKVKEIQIREIGGRDRRVQLIRYVSSGIAGSAFALSSIWFGQIIGNGRPVDMITKLETAAYWAISALATMVAINTILISWKVYDRIIAVKNVGSFKDDLIKTITGMLTVCLIVAGLLNLGPIGEALKGRIPKRTYVNFPDVVRYAVSTTATDEQHLVETVINSGNSELQNHIARVHPDGWLELKPGHGFLDLLAAYNDQVLISIKFDLPNGTPSQKQLSLAVNGCQVKLMFRSDANSQEYCKNISTKTGPGFVIAEPNGWYLYELKIDYIDKNDIKHNWNTLGQFKFFNEIGIP